MHQGVLIPCEAPVLRCVLCFIFPVYLVIAVVKLEHRTLFAYLIVVFVNERLLNIDKHTKR